MTGDRRPDLVVVAECQDRAVVGVEPWRVYLNTGAGFAPTATPFSLPPGYRPGTFGVFGREGANCAENIPGFVVNDVNGDQRPDVVVIAECRDRVVVGVEPWRVYLNTGVGFSPTATPFSLPPGYRPGTFGVFGRVGANCAENIPGFVVNDVNGDQRPDVVVIAECRDRVVVGVEPWRVYLNTGVGFDPTATPFSLPPGYRPGTFGVFGRVGANCAENIPGFVVNDMNGDRRPDVVVVAECRDRVVVGVEPWRVYLNTGVGFDPTATPFSLPPGYRPGTFGVFGRVGANCAENIPGFVVNDVNGDQRPDVVVVAECRDRVVVGVEPWRVYLNTGAGFAPTATPFSLPPGYRSGTFGVFGREGANCTENTPGFMINDMNGDQRPDIVTFAECGDPAIGTSHWKLYQNICM